MRRVGEGALAGIAAGVLVGVVARIAMRMVALGVPDGVMQLPSFTLGGTAMILVMGAIVGAPLGALYALVRPLLRVPAVWQAPLFSALLLVTLGPLFFVGAEAEFTSGGRIALFALLFPVFGLGLAVARPLANWIVGSRPEPWSALATAVAAGGAALVVFGIATLARDTAAARGIVATGLILAPVLLLGAAALRQVFAAAAEATSSPS